MVDGPIDAESDRANVTVWLAPTSKEKLAAGIAFTPTGIPCNAILILPVNPFWGLVKIETDEVMFPTTADVEFGESETVKSPTGGGGPCWPLPHPARNSAKQTNPTAKSGQFTL